MTLISFALLVALLGLFTGSAESLREDQRSDVLQSGSASFEYRQGETGRTSEAEAGHVQHRWRRRRQSGQRRRYTPSGGDLPKRMAAMEKAHAALMKEVRVMQAEVNWLIENIGDGRTTTTPPPEPTSPRPSPTTPHPEPTTLPPEPTTSRPDPTTPRPDRRRRSRRRAGPSPSTTTSTTTEHPDPTTPFPETTIPPPDSTTQRPQPTTTRPKPTTPLPTPRPDPTTSHPEPTTPYPEPTTARPEPTTPGPDPTTPRPEPTTPRPDPPLPSTTPEPTTPRPDPPLPSTTTQHPDPTTPFPETTTPRPEPTTPRPDPTSPPSTRRRRRRNRRRRSSRRRNNSPSPPPYARGDANTVCPRNRFGSTQLTSATTCEQAAASFELHHWGTLKTSMGYMMPEGCAEWKAPRSSGKSSFNGVYYNRHSTGQPNRYANPICSGRVGSTPPPPSYTLGDANADSCPGGSTLLESSTICQVAAKILKLRYWGTLKSSLGYMMPQGCTVWYKAGQSGFNGVYYNRHSTGRANRYAKPVCMKSRVR